MTPNLTTEFGERLTPLHDGRQGLRAALTCEVKQPTTDNQQPELDFVASDESVDRYNEVIKLEGWLLDNYRKNPVVMDSHDYSSIARILGRSVDVRVAESKLVNRVQFSTDNPLGALAYKMAKGGFIKSESVGFIPIEWIRGNESQGEPYRTYLKQELIEISLVPVPANPAATIGLALKTGAIARSDLKALEDFLKHFCSDTAELRSDSRAQGPGFDGAQLRQLSEQLYSPIRALLRRA